MKKHLIIIAGVFIVAGSYFYAGFSMDREYPQPMPEREITQPASESVSAGQFPGIPEDDRPSGASDPVISEKTDGKIEHPVPFLVQAPFGNWSDPVFQNACEEASIIMAMGWVDGVKAITAKDGQDKILDIAAFENETFGYNADTDMDDVRKIFQRYFQYQNVAVRKDIVLADLKNELQKGNIVIVPAFGQALANPNYTAPGPVAHMLVVTGHDPAKKEFITNDPGTRHGAGYRYGEKVLFDAIWEYPSGGESPAAPTASAVRKKNMLVVRPR